MRRVHAFTRPAACPWGALLCLALLAACGSSDDASDADAGEDAALDVRSGDAQSDVEAILDTSDDAPDAMDAAADGAADTADDAAGDAAVDAQDTGADGTDTGNDTSADTRDDASADVREDAEADALEDVGDDVVLPDDQVDWCRLQFPLDVSLALGAEQDFYVRVFEEGVTDVSAGNDPLPGLRVELGVGPDGSAPTDASWQWTAAEPNVGWTDSEEPGNDEYQAFWTFSAAGTFDAAFRVSLDEGTTYLYCDGPAGPGSDGAEDGYAPENAANVVVADLCADACVIPPPPVCADAGTVRAFSGPGACEVIEGEPVCTFAEVDETCETGASCEDAACVFPSVDFCRLQAPTEWTGATGDTVEYFARIYEAGVTDQSSATDPFDGLEVELGWGPDGSDPVDSEAWTWIAGGPNEGYVATEEPNNDEYVATLSLPEVGRYDTAFRASLGGVYTYCDTNAGVGQDGSQDGYQVANAGALDVVDACTPNPCDAPPANTCLSEGVASVYTAPGTCTLDEGAEKGARCEYVAEEVACDEESICIAGECVPNEPLSVDYCRLQFPQTITNTAGTEVDVFGRVYIEGWTDQSPGNDLDPRLIAGVGYGPSESVDPLADFVWIEAAPNPTWFGPEFSEEDVDEYVATWTLPEAALGTYAYVFRFSGDGGDSWTLCDRVVTESDASVDGYQAENAGVLELVERVSACDPNPCSSPPAATCEGNNALTYAPEGACEDVEGVAVCSYEESVTACADNQACNAGVCEPIGCDPNPCTEPARRVCSGDVVISIATPGSCLDSLGGFICDYAETPVENCADGGETCVDGACVGPAETQSIDFCRLQFPEAASLAPGEPLVVFGRLFIEGLTDQTTGNDLNEFVYAEVGVGPDGSTDFDGEWTWSPAAPNDEYDGASALGEPANDEYVGTIPTPAFDGSERDFALRFSGDGGETFTLCDLETEGSAGSADGYQPEFSGALTILAPPSCDDDYACAQGDTPFCEGDIAFRVVSPGECMEGAEALACAYTFAQEDCSEANNVCVDGTCQAPTGTNPITFCRLQFPLDATIGDGDSETFFVRYYGAGLTDIEPITTVVPNLRVQVGYGPEGRAPSEGPLAWTWEEGEANTGYDGTTSGEAANDEYQADLRPAPGTYAVAARVSGDNGATWLYCDGQDAGSSDGYQTENAGTLTVEAVE